jgi:hypothetical protein
MPVDLLDVNEKYDIEKSDFIFRGYMGYRGEVAADEVAKDQLEFAEDFVSFLDAELDERGVATSSDGISGLLRDFGNGEEIFATSNGYDDVLEAIGETRTKITVTMSTYEGEAWDFQLTPAGGIHAAEIAGEWIAGKFRERYPRAEVTAEVGGGDGAEVDGGTESWEEVAQLFFQFCAELCDDPTIIGEALSANDYTEKAKQLSK